MSKKKNIPQVETERSEQEMQIARFNAYMHRVCEINAKIRAEKESRNKAARIGGAAL
ncbi:MAG: hypothetical protein IK078_09775 [Lachnospiraceae bacterium]|nr:hypothetical protein [Lachnospiraceae bacterium]